MLTAERDEKTRRLDHSGTIGGLVPVVIKNVLLKLVTFGIYQFWATTNVRRYLWSRTSFDGDPLEWTGTGKELCKGFFAVLFLILLPLVILNGVAQHLIASGQVGLGGALSTTVGVIYATLVPIGLYRARRYRLSRTQWRGIRGTQEGQAFKFARLWWRWGLLSVLTLGLISPLGDLAMARYTLGNTVFGDRKLQFEGKARTLYPAYLAAWLGSLVIVAVVIAVMVQTFLHSPGLAAAAKSKNFIQLLPAIGTAYGALLLALIAVQIPRAHYQATLIRQLAAGCRWGDLRFRVDVNAWSLIGLAFPNILILIFTLGLGMPFAELRKARFIARRLTIIGEQDFSLVHQNQAERPTSGEGLVAIFDGVDM
jgi:uncharacterized membrane protein YjgN (DUF898 family)